MLSMTIVKMSLHCNLKDVLTLNKYIRETFNMHTAMSKSQYQNEYFLQFSSKLKRLSTGCKYHIENLPGDSPKVENVPGNSRKENY